MFTYAEIIQCSDKSSVVVMAIKGKAIIFYRFLLNSLAYMKDHSHGISTKLGQQVGSGVNLQNAPKNFWGPSPKFGAQKT